MSDLQLGLLAIGALVVAGVVLFNWLQERRLKARLEQAFGERPEDVLLRTASSSPASPIVPAQMEPRVRREPVLTSPDGGEAVPQQDGEATLPEIPAVDDEFEVVVGVDCQGEIPAGALADFLSQVSKCGKPLRCFGWSRSSNDWEDMGRSGADYRSVRITLQLVDRKGAISAAALAGVCDAARHCARSCDGVPVVPDVNNAMHRAHDLDRFCAEVDVAVGINVLAPEGGMFEGGRIRAVVEAAGFTLQPQGVFHYRDEAGRILFTLDNHEPAPFIPERIGSLSTSGITVLLDVPRVADGELAFDRLCVIGRGLAQALGGRLVDDNKVALTEAGLERIKRQLRALHVTMTGRGIEPGGPRALRLFS